MLVYGQNEVEVLKSSLPFTFVYSKLILFACTLAAFRYFFLGQLNSIQHL